MQCSVWINGEEQRLLIACLSRWKTLNLTFIPAWVSGIKKEFFSPFLQVMRRLWLNLFPNPLEVFLMQHNNKNKEKTPGELSCFVFCFVVFGLWVLSLSLFIYFTRKAPNRDFICCTLLLHKPRKKTKSTTARKGEYFFCSWADKQEVITK